MKIILSRDQANLVAEKYMDLANLALIGLVVAQFTSENVFNLWWGFIGLSLYAILYYLSYFVMRGGRV